MTQHDELEKALQELLKALPRCCNCSSEICSVIDEHRWPLCEKCWKDVLISGEDLKLSADMRRPVSMALQALRVSLSHSYAKLPETPAVAPQPKMIELAKFTEIELRAKDLRNKLRHLRISRTSALRQASFIAFGAGFFLATLLALMIHGL